MALKNYTSTVDVFTSLGEIQGALAKAGAKRIMVDYDDAGEPVAISFQLNTSLGPRGFTLPPPIDGTLRVFKKQKLKDNPEQAKRTAWRNIRDWVLAQLALMECCDVPADQIFLPYMADRNGTTLYEAYSSGRLSLGSGALYDGPYIDE